MNNISELRTVDSTADYNYTLLKMKDKTKDFQTRKFKIRFKNQHRN
jgi:hypothetical protein